MTQASERKPSQFFNLRSIKSSVKRLLKDYVATTILVVSISFTYQTLLSENYWNFVKGTTIDIASFLSSLFTHSAKYTLANLTIIFVAFTIVRVLKPKSWIDKIQYNQKEQLSFYVTQLLLQGADIQTKENLDDFCQDAVDILHNLFAQKSSANSSTWLIPERNQLILLCSNKNSKYNQGETHFSFRSGEGVVGNSWADGKIELYSEQQENKYYKNRNQCDDRAYICCPIIREPQNKYGILAVGSNKDIYWNDEDKESLKLIATVVSKTLNDLNDELKAKFNL